MKKNRSFYIRHFADYHSIQSDTHRTIELGCFPVASCGYGRYFGLFYTGHKPSVDAVMDSLSRQITFGDFAHYRTSNEIGVDEDEVRFEVKEALKKG